MDRQGEIAYYSQEAQARSVNRCSRSKQHKGPFQSNFRCDGSSTLGAKLGAGKKDDAMDWSDIFLESHPKVSQQCDSILTSG